MKVMKKLRVFKLQIEVKSMFVSSLAFGLSGSANVTTAAGETHTANVTALIALFFIRFKFNCYK